jgi:hypothetical protein
MLTRDPFRAPARHRKPHTAVTGALELLGAALVIAAVFAVLATASRPVAHTDRFGGMVAHAATHAAQRFTPSGPPLPHATASQAGTGHVRTVQRASRAGH